MVALDATGRRPERHLIMMHRGQIIHDFQGAEKRRIRPDVAIMI
jgi:ABC-type uncharacterized transport system ATPase component